MYRIAPALAEFVYFNYWRLLEMSKKLLVMMLCVFALAACEKKAAEAPAPAAMPTPAPAVEAPAPAPAPMNEAPAPIDKK